MVGASGQFPPGNQLVRLDLRGRQRRHFLFAAGGCFVIGLLVPVLLPSHWSSVSFVWFVGCWFGLMVAVALYYLRTAYGWIELDATGIRTSRVIRGRSIPWTEVRQITTRRYNGRGGGVTVTKVRTATGRTYFLPVPRTTSLYDGEFHDAVRYLQSRAKRHR